MSDQIERRPFYLKTDCCLSCGVLESIAPNIFAFVENGQCFIKRQPEGQSELDLVFEAMRSSEVDCLRYSEHDEEMLRRIGEAGMADLADDEGAKRYGPIVRDRAVFMVPSGNKMFEDEFSLVEAFRAEMRQMGMAVVPSLWKARRTHIAWYERHFHAVEFFPENANEEFLVVLRSTPSALQGVALIVHKWLIGVGIARIAWHSRVGLQRGEPGIPTPF